MADKKDTPDRRTVLATVAAAGALAAPLAASAAPAPMMMRRGLPTKINVDLGGVALPEREAAELEARIRADVLGAIAKAGIKVNEIPHGPHPGWLGIVVRPVQIPAGVKGVQGLHE